MNAYEGIDLGNSWSCVVSFTPRPLYSRGRAPGTHYIGGWVDPRGGLDDGVKILEPTGTLTPTPPSSSP
jgi:hypothetical protein